MAQPTNLLQGPEPVETAELHFKLHCRLKVFEESTIYEEGHCCILAVSQYYGLIFVGNLNGFSVISTKSLTAGISPDEFPKRNIILNLKPTHISVDISQKVLAVVCNSKPGSALIFYHIHSLAAKDVTPFKVTPVSKLVQNLSAEVVDLTWQPNADGSFVVCMSDGSVLAFPEGTKNETMFTLPSTTQATCFCWSPKGKQIVVGSASGTLSQYKPDLKLVKTLPSPPLFNGAAMVVSVLWISSFQFAVAYNDRSNPELFPLITIVNAAKNEPVTVINYDDVTYSSTLFRNHQIYMSHQPAWNLIFVSSANSIETAVLHMKENSSWEQWLLGDASRAELPLNPDRQETFPLGWAVDFTSQETIPWGEGTLPPMPRLLLVSDEGLLCVFNVVNTMANAPQLCAPPKENFDHSHFTVSVKAPPPVASDLSTPPQAAKGILGSPPTLAPAKPAFTFQTTPGFGGFTVKPQTKPPQAVAVNLQQQPEQPQLQVQQQQPQPIAPIQLQQPLPAQSEPSSTAFKLSISQFGAQPTFSFGTTSNVAFPSKPPPVAKVNEPTGSAFALQPSSSQKDLFSGKNLPQSTPVKQGETPAEKTSGVPVGKKSEEVEGAGRTEEAASKGESPEVTVVDDSVYLSALVEEVEHFNSELQQLSARFGTLEIQLGTEEDKARMKKSIEGLYSFWEELKETTEGQSSEIHAVVMDLMEAFAWLENAKSRNLQRKNPSYIELKKSEELDLLNARHMNEISHLKYYIENQLKQLTGYLEKEWMDHQENYRNEVKNKMAVPPLEEVYKTMHYQLKILQKQKALVDELKEKIALKKRKNKSQSFLISSANPIRSDTNGNRVSELSKLAENLLQLKINREEDSPQHGTWEMMKSQLNHISERSKKLTRDKQTALRDVLSERDMVKIRPVKTTLESSSFLRSLHLDETAPLKTPKRTPFHLKSDHCNQKDAIPFPNAQFGPESSLGKSKIEDKSSPVAKPEPSRTVSVPAENPAVPLTVQPFAKLQEKSPLSSLSKIVSNIGSKNESTVFVFRRPSFQKAESGIDPVRQEEPKANSSQPFTFGIGKPGESIFAKQEPTVFGANPISVLPSSITVVTTKSHVSKPSPTPSITIISVAATTATSTPFRFSAATSTPSTTSSSFSFTPATTTPANSTALPKLSLLFSGKETTSPFGTPPTTTAASSTSLFASSVPIFGGSTKTPATFPPPTSLFGSPISTTDTPAQPPGFTLTHSETKSSPPTYAIQVKSTPETEDVDVEEPSVKPESTPDKPKDSPKPSAVSTIFSTPSAPSKTAPPEVSSSTAAFIPASTPHTSALSIFPKSAPVPVTSSSDISPLAPPTLTASSTPPVTTSSLFSFSSVTTLATSDFFAQTATTPTTTASIFSSPTSTPALFSQVSSTTPTTTTTTTTNLFGGSTSTSPSVNLFSTSNTIKTSSDQPSTPSTTSDNLFKPSTPNTATVFPQKTDSVDATANLFGQLLSDSTKPVFGGTSPTPNPTPTTTPNLFASPKSIFDPPTTTISNLFGSLSSSSSTFGTSVFGQSTTTSCVFGQSQTSTSSSLFGQTTFNAFGKATSAVSSTQTAFKSNAFNEPIFGSTVFGQTFTKTTSPPTFGTPSSSIFGGTPSSTTTNVFQTPTTSTTFGSTSPGPFSGGNSSFGESTFGSSNATLQKSPGGFGSPPVFGSSPAAPAFGGSPTFGGSHSFGSLPTFGSVSQGTFGQSSGSTTFENFANQNTVGFGNLAQQSQSQGFGGGFRSPTFENKPNFEGHSFSSWRSK